jgi:hypothetical protein
VPGSWGGPASFSLMHDMRVMDSKPPREISGVPSLLEGRPYHDRAREAVTAACATFFQALAL